VTPQDLARQLAELTQENYRGVTAVFEAEKKLAEAEYKLDGIEAKSFLKATGNVAERTAQSRLSSADARLERDLAKAEFNRVKLKLKAIESALMASATQAKLLAVESRV
jgi:hypothetical protein